MGRRLVIVALLSTLSVALWAGDIPRVFGHLLGTSGFVIAQHATVGAVDANSPAAHAGIREGQQIDWPGTPLHSRLLLINGNLQNLHPIQQFPVRLVRGQGAQTVVVASEPESAADTATIWPRIILDLALLAAGIALVLLRPSKATWGFFVFTAFNNGAPINAIIWYGPPAYQIAMTIFVGPVFSFISDVSAIVFALNLLIKPPIPQWRRLAEAATYSIAGGAVLLASWSILSSIYYGRTIDTAMNAISVLQVAGATAPPILFLVTYALSDAAARERIRWLIFAFTVNALTYFVYAVQNLAGVAVPYWLWATFASVNILIVSITVSYAVLKHHVIDINVAISRALVYTILSTIIVGAFTLVDLFFTSIVTVKSVGLMADIALALVLGFFFNALHFRVDRFVDRVLFRQRHAAEEHLRTVMRGLPFAVSQAQVDRLVVDEPARSFFLTGAVLFTCNDEGQFELRRSFGTSLHGLKVASREDALPAYLQGERCALRLNRHGWDVPGIAIPIFSHGDLAGIVAYGLHQNGTDLDGEEIALFEQIANAAGNAYDRLEAQRLRDEVRDLRLQRA